MQHHRVLKFAEEHVWCKIHPPVHVKGWLTFVSTQNPAYFARQCLNVCDVRLMPKIVKEGCRHCAGHYPRFCSFVKAGLDRYTSDACANLPVHQSKSHSLDSCSVHLPAVLFEPGWLVSIYFNRAFLPFSSSLVARQQGIKSKFKSVKQSCNLLFQKEKLMLTC